MAEEQGSAAKTLDQLGVDWPRDRFADGDAQTLRVKRLGISIADASVAGSPRRAPPIAFLGTAQGAQDERSWRGPLVRDEYEAYDSVMRATPGPKAAVCLAHARRKFDELMLDSGKSAVAQEALRRSAEIYRLERKLSALTSVSVQPRRLDAMAESASRTQEQLVSHQRTDGHSRCRRLQ